MLSDLTFSILQRKTYSPLIRDNWKATKSKKNESHSKLKTRQLSASKRHDSRSMDKEEIDQQLLDSQFLENVETFVTDGY